MEDKPKGNGMGRDKLGVWDEHNHTTIHKIDNQKGLLCGTENNILFLITYKGKESEKEDIYMYIHTYVYIWLPRWLSGKESACR